ncbi:hypothetical protein YH66_05345 [[Brevibacterium] flavum]|uniref:Uncharacterized protein n=1 Tax=[Brevibacterium] flavum TaxID=92706 RepID=A0A0F6SQY5_9CORY|nr:MULTISPECIES: hypothetical protein [Corynebacterium]AKF27019.1 hypothetical protein YH66_05345 [[Brevibacterium] flavum]ANE07842.1 hypothetical protein A3654_05330 [Corynebacterium glutamicum]AST20259.1 hypothetical protein CEY17_05400 [Corynebacterium glutamicum ATCC 14067]KEI22735.1 hypothetical protein KIQ_009185 [Corynebacterium glutamicum ATCC 14067]KIH74272.1 hypothetical protein SD36_05365 [Corynebacterium glutamicum]
MTDPLAFPMPETTIVKPEQTALHAFPVTAGPWPFGRTIALPVGANIIIMDTQVPVGSINVRIRVAHGDQIFYANPYEDFMGTKSTLIKIVVDQENTVISVNGTATAPAVGTARVALTIVQAGTM